MRLYEETTKNLKEMVGKEVYVLDTSLNSTAGKVDTLMVTKVGRKNIYYEEDERSFCIHIDDDWSKIFINKQKLSDYMEIQNFNNRYIKKIDWRHYSIEDIRTIKRIVEKQKKEL